MNLHRFKQAAATATALLLIAFAAAQEPAGDKVDLDALAQIKHEAFQDSHVMDNLYYMSEVYGPRVTNSQNHRAAAEWAMEQMKEWGLKTFMWRRFPLAMDGRSRSLWCAGDTGLRCADRFPLAWTPGTNGPITADAVWAPIHSKEDFAKYHGKLKGKVVLMFDPPTLQLHTRADAQPSPTDERFWRAEMRAVAPAAVGALVGEELVTAPQVQLPQAALQPPAPGRAVAAEPMKGTGNIPRRHLPCRAEEP